VLPCNTGTALNVPLAMTTIYNRSSFFPIVLTQDEGLLIGNVDTGPATGTFELHVQMRWFETVKELVII
jgi:hypothetical protein